MLRFKVIGLIVAVSMLLAACATAAAPTEAPAAPAATEAPAAPAATEAPAAKVWTYPDMTVGFLQTGSEGGWRAANTASFKETAEQLGSDPQILRFTE